MPAGADGDALEAFTGQPALFAGLDCDLPTVNAARQFFHTGTTTTQHEQDAARIVAAASLGWSVRKIARELRHSRNTVAAVLRLAESAGKVEPVQRRVLAAAAAAVHADIEEGNRMIEEAETPQEVSAAAALRRSTWVGVGILADKVAPGQPSITVNVGAGSVVQVVQDYARELAALSSADSASVGMCAVSPVSVDTPQIVAGGVVVDVSAAVSPVSLDHGALDPNGAQAGTGAGGVGSGGGTENVDGTT